MTVGFIRHSTTETKLRPCGNSRLYATGSFPVCACLYIFYYGKQFTMCNSLLIAFDTIINQLGVVLNLITLWPGYFYININGADK